MKEESASRSDEVPFPPEEEAPIFWGRSTAEQQCWQAGRLAGIEAQRRVVREWLRENAAVSERGDSK